MSRFAPTLIGLALLAGLPACSTDPSSRASGPGGGGKLTVLAAEDVDFIDPGQTYDTFGFTVAYATQRPLVSYRPGSAKKAQPDLAESMPRVSRDGRRVTVRIRRGVRFSPPVRREVKAGDVKYAIERGFSEEVANGYVGTYFDSVKGAAALESGEASELSGLRTPDDRTLVFELDEPLGGLVAGALALPITAPVPAEYARRFDRRSPSAYGDHQVATGPYMVAADASGKLTGHEPGKAIRLVRNPSWEPSTDHRPAHLDEIEVQEGNEDATVASRRILGGEHMVNGDFPPPPAVLKQLARKHGDQLSLVPAGGNRYVSLNTTAKPLDNVDVRRAVVAGFDRNAMRLTRGGALLGDIATHFLPPGMPGFEEAGGVRGPGFDFLRRPDGDPALAAAYMRRAGYPSGRYEGDDEVLMVGTREGGAQGAAEVAQAQLEELGFDVKLRLTSQDAMYASFCGRPKAEIAVCPNVGWSRDFSDPQTILDGTFNGEQILPEGNVNWPELSDPRIDAAMERAATLTDPVARARAWGAIDRMITAEAPAVPWAWDLQPAIRSRDVRGVTNEFLTGWDLSYTSLR